MSELAASTLQEQFNRKVQKQLDAIESIREDLTAEGISVPGVVVVGAQSAGKSSVLEASLTACTAAPCCYPHTAPYLPVP